MSDPHDAIKCGGSKGFAVPPGGAIALELAPELSASVQIRTRDGSTVTATLAVGSTLHVQTPKEGEPPPDSVVISFLTSSADGEPSTAH